MVRRGHSFASHRTDPSSSGGQSVSVSNSVSHVRVEVGDRAECWASHRFYLWFNAKNSENRPTPISVHFC